MKGHNLEGVAWEVFVACTRMISRLLLMSSCKLYKLCNSHWEMAVWWRTPIIRANIRGRLFLYSTWCESRHCASSRDSSWYTGDDDDKSNNVILRQGQLQHILGLMKIDGVYVYLNNNKCCGSKSSLISSYILSEVAPYFLGANLR